MLQLQPNYQITTDSSLQRTLRDLLKAEPVFSHDIFGCWTPDCPQCAEWRAWAKQVKEVSGELQNRQSK